MVSRRSSTASFTKDSSMLNGTTMTAIGIDASWLYWMDWNKIITYCVYIGQNWVWQMNTDTTITSCFTSTAQRATNRIFDQNGQNLCCSASLESKLDATTNQHAPPIHTVHTPIYRDTLLHRYEYYEFRIMATGCLWRIASREHRRDLWSNPWRRQRIWNRWKVSIAGRESSSKRSSCSHPHFFLSCQSPYHFLLGLWYMR